MSFNAAHLRNMAAGALRALAASKPEPDYPKCMSCGGTGRLHYVTPEQLREASKPEPAASEVDAKPDAVEVLVAMAHEVYKRGDHDVWGPATRISELRVAARKIVEERDAEIATLKRDALEVARAVGIVHEADGHDDVAGPPARVLQEVREAVAAEKERDALRAGQQQRDALLRDAQEVAERAMHAGAMERMFIEKLQADAAAVAERIAALAGGKGEAGAESAECCVPSPGEPQFVLLARDPMAPILVDAWASLRSHLAGNPSKVEKARAVAKAMREWKAELCRRAVAANGGA